MRGWGWLLLKWLSESSLLVSTSFHVDSWLGHVTYFGPQSISNHDTKTEWALSFGTFSWNSNGTTMWGDLAQTIFLEDVRPHGEGGLAIPTVPDESGPQLGSFLQVNTAAQTSPGKASIRRQPTHQVIRNNKSLFSVLKFGCFVMQQ